MTNKQYLKIILILGIVFISLSGWAKHLYLHPTYLDKVNYIPYISGLFSIFLLPLLFFFNKTVSYAYLLNGMTVIIGTITMVDYTIVNFRGDISFSSIFTETIFPDILILWTKFLLGKVIFDLTYLNDLNILHHKGKFLKFPNMGFWLVHLIAMSCVYILGKIFWK